MEYLATAFFNDTPGSRFWRYEDGNTLVQSKLEPFFVQGDTPEQAAEMVFRVLNYDTRPNGSYERSLSAGDVVKLTPRNGKDVHIWMAVEGIGFRQIDGPILTPA